MDTATTPEVRAKPASCCRAIFIDTGEFGRRAAAGALEALKPMLPVRSHRAALFLGLALLPPCPVNECPPQWPRDVGRAVARRAMASGPEGVRALLASMARDWPAAWPEFPNTITSAADAAEREAA